MGSGNSGFLVSIQRFWNFGTLRAVIVNSTRAASLVRVRAKDSLGNQDLHYIFRVYFLRLPERMLQNMGLYHNLALYVCISSSDYFILAILRLLYRIMICLAASPYVAVYPIYRQYLMPLHAAIIVSTFPLHYCSSGLLIAGCQPEKTTPPRYLRQKHRNKSSRQRNVRLLHMYMQLIFALLSYLEHVRLRSGKLEIQSQIHPHSSHVYAPNSRTDVVFGMAQTSGPFVAYIVS